MLSRQVWRLIQAPDSLCARVLRAKYYPDGDIFAATATPGISYVWRSILQGVEVFKEGMVWRVGNGDNIRIWQDPWLPSGAVRYPRTRRGSTLLTRVAELIGPYTNSWDTQLVRQTFCQEDANVILSIPIFEHHDDFVAWQFDRKGLFYVRSAYRIHVDLLRRQCQRQTGECSSGREEEKKMWRHLFMWRLAHNSHPLLRNVEHIGVELDTSCVVCHRLPEDGGHLFLRCKKVKKMWRACGLKGVRQSLLECQTSRRLLEELFRIPKDENLKAICLLWLWWTERNKTNHNQNRASAEEFQSSVTRHVTEWREYNAKHVQPRVQRIQKWVKPALDVVPGVLMDEGETTAHAVACLYLEYGYNGPNSSLYVRSQYISPLLMV